MYRELSFEIHHFTTSSCFPWGFVVVAVTLFPRSVMTLFRSILGGLDWEYAAEALIPVGWFWVQAGCSRCLRSLRSLRSCVALMASMVIKAEVKRSPHFLSCAQWVEIGKWEQLSWEHGALTDLSPLHRLLWLCGGLAELSQSAVPRLVQQHGLGVWLSF